MSFFWRTGYLFFLLWVAYQIFKSQKTDQISWALLCYFEVPLVRTFNNRKCLLQVSKILQWLRRELWDSKFSEVRKGWDGGGTSHCALGIDMFFCLQEIRFCDNSTKNHRPEKLLRTPFRDQETDPCGSILSERVGWAFRYSPEQI